MRKRWQISVRGETYDRIRKKADEQGVSMLSVVEAALEGALDVPLIPPDEQDRYVSDGPIELGEPRKFFCASCGNDQYGSPRRLPWGRDAGVVDVCLTCVDEHPRAGRYGFGEGGKPAGGSGFARAPGSGKAGSR